MHILYKGFVTADMIISVLCLILFNYPLKQLIKECDIEDLEIIQLTKKYAILTTTAIGMYLSIFCFSETMDKYFVNVNGHCHIINSVYDA